MNLLLAIGLIWLAFLAGYCLSGMLGAGTREELERENSILKRKLATLEEEVSIMEKEIKFRKSMKV